MNKDREHAESQACFIVLLHDVEESHSHLHKGRVNAGKPKLDDEGVPRFMAKASSKDPADKREMLTRDLRAKCYISHDYLRTIWHTNVLSTIPGMEQLVKRRIAADDPKSANLQGVTRLPLRGE